MIAAAHPVPDGVRRRTKDVSDLHRFQYQQVNIINRMLLGVMAAQGRIPVARLPPPGSAATVAVVTSGGRLMATAARRSAAVQYG
jgi:hypothetical protein